MFANTDLVTIVTCHRIKGQALWVFFHMFIFIICVTSERGHFNIKLIDYYDDRFFDWC